ncbi:septation protein SepH [Nocardiopsis xinjiangensis]|uniref:septation protein SepH n=1 Tax=Nocardiopsis xinjiangensis TaxID=124285 RepID=UPI00034DA8F9|nr:septation protein SepH [Nocardiopsis xinjiangensis]
MHELRLVAVSEDGTYLVLAGTGRGPRFMLPVDDRLRAAVRGQFSRLGQYEIEVENPLRPKEIQARIRSGETAEAISEISGIPIERVRWFEGPVLQEREYIAQQAQNATVRAQDEVAPGSSLEELVTKRIGAHQLETGDAEWDSWKREDRTWQIKLVYLHQGEERVAHWLYEPRHNSVSPSDEEAARFSSPEPFEAPQAPGANVTPFAPRRSEPAPEVPRGEPYPAQERTENRPPVPSRQEGPRRDETLRPMSGRPQTDQFGVPLTEERRRLAEERRRPAEARHPRPGQEPYFAPVEEPPSPEVGRRPEPAAPPPAPERPAARRPRVDNPGSERPGGERPAAEPPAEPEGPRRMERPSAPDWLGSRPTRAAEPSAPDPAPPAAEPPAQPEHPRRQRATIDLNETGRPRPAAEQAAPPAPAADQSAEHPAPKRKGRGRRASVPSWDEIMFGAKKDD